MKILRCRNCHSDKTGLSDLLEGDCMLARAGRSWPHAWEETEDLCRAFFIVLRFYCNEPVERHCATPPDPEHLVACGMAHHKFSPNFKEMLPPKPVLTKELAR